MFFGNEGDAGVRINDDLGGKGINGGGDLSSLHSNQKTSGQSNCGNEGDAGDRVNDDLGGKEINGGGDLSSLHSNQRTSGQFKFNQGLITRIIPGE